MSNAIASTINVTGIATLTNAGNIIAAAVMTNQAATASTLAFYDANKKLISAAASGAVPVDANGTAATFAQVNALGPNGGAFPIQTNGMASTYTNAVNIASPSYYMPTSYVSANFAINNNASFLIVSNNNLFFVTKTKTNLIINGN